MTALSGEELEEARDTINDDFDQVDTILSELMNLVPDDNNELAEEQRNVVRTFSSFIDNLKEALGIEAS